MIYKNIIRPSTLFGLALLVVAVAAGVIWIGVLFDPASQGFDAPGLTVLALALGCGVLSLLFFARIPWIRLTTSILLHLLIVALAVSLYAVASEEEQAGVKMFALGLWIGLAGLCTVGILALHGSAMRFDFSGQTEPSPEPVCRQTRLRRVAIVLTGLCMAALAYGAWRIVPLLLAKPSITVDYLAEANRLSKPLDYDPNLNAAPHYDKFFTEFVPLPPELEDHWKAWPGDLSAEQRAALVAWVPNNQEILESLAKAATCPYWWQQYISTDGALSGIELQGLDAARHCVWGVLLLAKYRASEGDIREALSLLMQVHCLGEHWTSKGTLVEQLTGLAVCGLNYAAVRAILDHGRPDLQLLEETLAFFRQRTDCIDVPRFMTAEELYGYDSIQRNFTDDGNGNGRLIPTRLYEAKKRRASLYTRPISCLDALWISLNHPGRSETRTLFAMYFAGIVDLAAQSPWQLHAAMTSYEEELEELFDGNYYLGDGYAATAQCIRLGWRGKADARAVVAVLAVLTYKAQQGHWPQSLAELAAEGLLDHVPMDPYSDGPLVYRVTDESFTLYSVGEDFSDDGGEPGNWDEFGTDRVFWPVP